MKKDQHVKTSMADGANSCMETYIRNAGIRNVDEITVVDEFNPQDPEPLNVHDYYYEYLRFRINQLTTINVGLEVVLSEESKKDITEAVSKYNFDLVVGSTDPTPMSATCEDAYQEYLENVLENIRIYKDEIDVISSQIDMISTATNNPNIDLKPYQNIIDEILKTLIENNIGIEVNSSTFEDSGLINNPSIQILKRYRELGGNIITIGSYACSVDDLSLYFEHVYKVLENLGFQAISQFHKHKPEQIEIKRFRRAV
ncbi:MAG: PHP domain-containing protein [Erysipelotrichales bacterium]|nr:PHP domain-containing protein [Erysipelotrichales bacterium]